MNRPPSPVPTPPPGWHSSIPITGQVVVRRVGTKHMIQCCRVGRAYSQVFSRLYFFAPGIFANTDFP